MCITLCILSSVLGKPGGWLHLPSWDDREDECWGIGLISPLHAAIDALQQVIAKVTDPTNAMVMEGKRHCKPRTKFFMIQAAPEAQTKDPIHVGTGLGPS